LQEAGRMNTLCNNLLLASQIEAGDYTLTIEKINISDLITESVNDFKMRFPKRIIKFGDHSVLYFNGDRLLLQMAVNNLLDNAIKYSLKDERVDIELKENKEINLIIKDGGKGIPDDEKNKIFDKFYRIGNLHTREAKGTGLGLYLTKKIVEQHGGTIIVKDNNPQGSIFEIKL
jgi:signal transduction histidine kinase